AVWRICYQRIHSEARRSMLEPRQGVPEVQRCVSDFDFLNHFPSLYRADPTRARKPLRDIDLPQLPTALGVLPPTVHNDLPARIAQIRERVRILDLLDPARDVRTARRLHADRLTVPDAHDVHDAEQVLPHLGELIEPLDHLSAIAALPHDLQATRRGRGGHSPSPTARARCRTSR